MPVIERPSGLRVVLPETFRVAEMPAPRRARRTRVPLDEPVVPTDAASASAETGVLIAALESQRIELVDAVPLQPAPGVAPGAPAGRRRRGPAAAVPPRQTVELSLPIQADEHAVVRLNRKAELDRF